MKKPLKETFKALDDIYRQSGLSLSDWMDFLEEEIYKRKKQLIGEQPKTKGQVYKITKNYQGGQGIYYAVLPEGKVPQEGSFKPQLEDWGEATNGGHNYGYRIKMRRVKNIPKDSKILLFNKWLLEDEK